MQCQGQRGVLEIRVREHRALHVPRPPVRVRRARLDGFLRGRRLSEHGGGDRAGARRARLASLGARPRAAPRRSWSVPCRTSGSWLADLIGRNPPPADEFDIRRVEFGPGEIRILVRNPQSDDLTIASVTVDDAIVRFTVDGPTTLGRLRSSTIVVPYAWVEDDPITVGVTSSTGIETVEGDPGGSRDPEASVSSFLGYALIGVLVGVLPIALGLLWLPALRQAGPRWLGAFMAFTAGLLSFLGVEALAEAFEFQSLLPAALGGAGLVLLGVALSFLGMTALRDGSVAAAVRPGSRSPARRDRHRRPQPGRGSRDRCLVRARRAPARHVPDRRVHDPQHHRGARHRYTRCEDPCHGACVGRPRPRGRSSNGLRSVDRRVSDERRSCRSVLRDRRRGGVPGRSRGRALRRPASARRACGPGMRSAAFWPASPRCTSPASSPADTAGDPRNLALTGANPRFIGPRL